MKMRNYKSCVPRFLGFGLICLGTGMVLPDFFDVDVYASGEGPCCTPAHVDNPSNPGGCDDDNCGSCDDSSCSADGLMSEVAVDGDCDNTKPNASCSTGAAVRTVRQGAYECEDDSTNGTPDCHCRFRILGTSTQVQVTDCTGTRC